MNSDHHARTQRLSQQINAGSYRVNPAAVADAILRRLSDIQLAGQYRAPEQKAVSRSTLYAGSVSPE